MRLPDGFLDELRARTPLAAIIDRHRPTVSAGVPTIWSDLLRFAQSNPVDLSSLRMITAGGAAVRPAMDRSTRLRCQSV